MHIFMLMNFYQVLVLFSFFTLNLEIIREFHELVTGTCHTFEIVALLYVFGSDCV